MWLLGSVPWMSLMANGFPTKAVHLRAHRKAVQSSFGLRKLHRAAPFVTKIRLKAFGLLYFSLQGAVVGGFPGFQDWECTPCWSLWRSLISPGSTISRSAVPMPAALSVGVKMMVDHGFWWSESQNQESWLMITIHMFVSKIVRT